MPNEDLPECDVVMKGGITSGVVYPKTVEKLKDRYRFRNIGGTSAGAIAAAITAAAEFDRDNGGFARIEQLDGELSEHLSDLFQPSPELSRLYSVVFGSSKGGFTGAAWRAVMAYWPAAVTALLLAGFLAFGVDLTGAQPWLTMAVFILVAVPVMFTLIILFAVLDIVTRLPKAEFGMCPGRTQKGYSFPALSDWITSAIERAAGRPAPGSPDFSPLTFSDLETSDPAKKISLRMMTTDLSLGLGQELPLLRDNNYFWTEADFRKLFPDQLVDWMIAECTKNNGTVLEKSEDGAVLYPFPGADGLPVAVAVRMSLSFPILITAVPLYRKNFTTVGADGHDNKPPLRVLFSDGGISSNFPIHLFDSLLPKRPTFGISLNRFHENQQQRRIYLPVKATRGRWLLINSHQNLSEFLWAIVDTAKSWHETKQSVLDGYRERIVRIYLKDDEGGLNLGMSEATIGKLGSFGGRAGALLAADPLTVSDVNHDNGSHTEEPDIEPFDFDQHRWRRFLVTYQTLERTLYEMEARWSDDGTGIRKEIDRLIEDPPSFKGSKKVRKEMRSRFNALMKFAAATFDEPLQVKWPRNFPKAESRLRIVAEDGPLAEFKLKPESESKPKRYKKPEAGRKPTGV